MIEYWQFRNTDAVGIVDIWRHQEPLAGMLQPLTLDLLETTVLSKTCFDPRGLILAGDHGQALGFVHAGFGPARDGTCIDFAVGSSCMLLVKPHPQQREIASGLLHRSEQYLRQLGAQTLLGGAIDQVAPFYLGLYGGASLPGVLAEDQRMLQFFHAAGYVERDKREIWQCSLGQYRPAIDRVQLQLRRAHEVKRIDDPPVRNWWEACHVGRNEHMRYVAQAKQNGTVVGMLRAWDMEPLASSRGIHAQGICEVEIDSQESFEPLATYLLGEVLRAMSAAGITLAEIQIAPDNTPLLKVLKRLGFQQVSGGVVLERPRHADFDTPSS